MSANLRTPRTLCKHRCSHAPYDQAWFWSYLVASTSWVTLWTMIAIVTSARAVWWGGVFGMGTRGNLGEWYVAFEPTTIWITLQIHWKWCWPTSLSTSSTSSPMSTALPMPLYSTCTTSLTTSPTPHFNHSCSCSFFGHFSSFHSCCFIPLVLPFLTCLFSLPLLVCRLCRSLTAASALFIAASSSRTSRAWESSAPYPCLRTPPVCSQDWPLLASCIFRWPCSWSSKICCACCLSITWLCSLTMLTSVAVDISRAASRRVASSTSLHKSATQQGVASIASMASRVLISLRCSLWTWLLWGPGVDECEVVQDWDQDAEHEEHCYSSADCKLISVVDVTVSDGWNSCSTSSPPILESIHSSSAATAEDGGGTCL